VPNRHAIAGSVAAILLAAAAVAVAAEDTFSWPGTHAGQRAEALVAAINTGDEAALRAYDAEHRAESAQARRPADQFVQMMLQIHEVAGALVPLRIDRSEADEIELIVRLVGMDGWGRVTVTCEAEPPHGVTLMRFEPTGDPDAPEISYDDWTTLDQLVARARADADQPAMAVAVVRGDDIETAAAGVRVLGEQTPVTAADRFHIGSVTKSMTATVVGKLIEDGLLRWDMTLAEALPDVEMQTGYRDATIEMLLQHRAGIPRHMTMEDEEMQRHLGVPGSPTDQRAAWAAEVLMEDPIAEPNTATNYSNAGYAIAGLIAERAAGKPWETLLAEIIFEPLGMTTAGVGWPATPQRPDEPRGHGPDGPQTLGDYVLGAFMGPAGDVHCSAADLARYARMHLRGLRGIDGPLKAETIKRLHTSLQTDGTQRYACGWVLRERDEGGTLHWHNGSAGTFYALVAIDPHADEAFVVLANCANGSSQPIAWKVVEAIASRDAG